MKIASYSARNVMRVSEIDFNMQGRHLFLVGGKNNQGKTSAITALLMALCGRSGMDYPEISLKEGEDKGWVKVQLEGGDGEPTGLTVELFLRRKRDGQVAEEFRVLDADGKETASPRTLLNRLCELRGFDPLSFERLDKKAKRDLLTKLLGLDLSAEKSAYKKAYDDRTLSGSEGKRLKAQYDGMPTYPGVPEQEVSVTELMAELERRQQLNGLNEAHRKKLKTIEDDYYRHGESVKKSEEDVERAKAELTSLEVALTKARENASAVAADVAEQHKFVSGLSDHNEKEVQDQIKASSEINAKVRANAAKKAAESSLTTKRTEYETLNKACETIQESMKQKLQSAPWPVPGLSLDDEGVLLDGLPIEQASKSRRIDVSVEIGMALNPKLKLLVCQDGGDLDTDSLAALGKKLEQRDYQMLLELVTRTAEDEALCQVIVRDGAVVETVAA